MEGRHVDVTIISAENLKKVSLIGKMRTYAWVWIDPAFRQATAVDERGGSNPTWDQQLSFPVPERFFQQPHARLTVEIYSKATLFDDKFVGAASLPVSEIVQKGSADEAASTLDVRRRSGEVKGSLRISVRAGAAVAIGPAPPFSRPPPEACLPAAAANGYPPPAAPAYSHGHYQPPAAAYGQEHYQPPPYPPEAAYGQGYYQQPPPPYYQAQPPPPPQKRPGGMGGMGMGLGAGLLAGAAGGLLVGDLVDDAFDGDDGGF